MCYNTKSLELTETSLHLGIHPAEMKNLKAKQNRAEEVRRIAAVPFFMCNFSLTADHTWLGSYTVCILVLAAHFDPVLDQA